MSKTKSVLVLLLITHLCPTAAESGAADVVELTTNGATCWFQDPRAVYIDGRRRRTYAGWVSSRGQLIIGAYDHESADIETLTIRTNWDRDDHNNNSFLVLPDNRLMIFYARHNKPGLYCRTSEKPESIVDWGPEVMVTDKRATYSHPVLLRDEQRIYVFWRHETWKPTFSTSEDGKTWTPPQMMLQEPGKEQQSVRPYIKIASDDRYRIFFAFTDGHPRNEPLNSIHYLCYQRGKFFKADNSLVGAMHQLPLAISQSDLVYSAKPSGVRAWVWDIASDSNGAPVIVYTRLPAEDQHHYHYARWDGKAWRDTKLVLAGKWFPETRAGDREKEPHYSGGITLNHADPSEVFLSRQVDGQFEIEKWTTTDKGASWQSESITKNSNVLNIRPVVPRGYAGQADHVLWMRGHYRHYTDFHTGIRALVPAAMDD